MLSEDETIVRATTTSNYAVKLEAVLSFAQFDHTSGRGEVEELFVDAGKLLANKLDERA